MTGFFIAFLIMNNFAPLPLMASQLQGYALAANLCQNVLDSIVDTLDVRAVRRESGYFVTAL
jgi:hypothetical protein